MLFFRLGSVPLMQPDEGRNSEVAREMAVGSSWLVPTLEGLPYLDKPALYFAMVAASLSVFGVNEWGARLPSALSGVAILAMVYRFSSRHFSRATAAFGVIVLATSPLFFAFSRIVILDATLAACTVAAVFSAFTAESGPVPDRRWHAAAAAFSGIGVLVKGPVGVLVPAAVVVVYFWVDGRASALKRVFAVRNVVIVLALVVPWFAALVRAYPEFAHYGLVEETLTRFFTPSFNRGGPFWYFVPALLISIFPWALLFVPAAFGAWPARDRLTAADRLLVTWVIVVVVFFSLSRTKQPAYILTAVVAAAALVARGLGRAWTNRGGRATRLVARGSLVLAGIALVAAGALGIAAARGIAGPGRLSAMPDDARAIWLSWPRFVTALLIVAVLAAAAYWKRNVGLSVAAFAAFPLALVTVAFPAYAGFARARSAKPLAGVLASAPADAEIACFEAYPAGLSFYLGRTITVVSESAKPLRSNFILYWMSRTASAPAALVLPSDRDRWLAHGPRTVRIVAPDEAHADLAAWLGGGVPVEPLVPGWWGASVPSSASR